MKKIYLSVCICCLAFMNAFAQCPTMTSPNSITICSGKRTNIYLTSDMPSSYTWIGSDNPNTTGESITMKTSGTLSDSIINNGASFAQTVTYTVTPTATVGGCVGTAQIVNIIVNPLPTVTVNSPTICAGQIVKLTASGAVSHFLWSSGAIVASLNVHPYNTTTYYSVFGSDSLGCMSIATSTVTVNSCTNCFANYYYPIYDTLQNTFTLTVDSTTSTSATSYHWDFGDGNTSTLATPTHTYTLDTTYNVCLKIKTATNDSCTYCREIGKDYLGNIYRTSGFTINVVNSNLTGISSISSNENSVIVYPNPFNNQLHIVVDKTSSIKITDIIGRQIYSGTVNPGGASIDAASFNSGVYFITITTGQNSVTKKLIKN